jgi:hypothetical protein
MGNSGCAHGASGNSARHEAPATLLPFIVILVSLTIAVAVYRLAPLIGEGQVLFDGTPDRPAAFGYRMAWLAIRTDDPVRLAADLGLVTPVTANWNSGIGSVYDDRLGEAHIYVTPPVDGWCFVVGLALPHPAAASFADKHTPLLVGLGARYREVQYFFTYPLIDLFAWARVSDGRLLRSFAVGDTGVIVNRGRVTREERALGLKLFELRGVRGRKGDAGGELILHPTEDHVLKLAGTWGIDPSKLDRPGHPRGLGVIGLAPPSWKPERLRKTA